MAILGIRLEKDITYDAKGATARRVYVCEWDDVDPIYDPGAALGLPKYGDAWDATDAPLLKCVQVECRHLGVDHAEVSASYSTDGEVIADFYTVRLRAAVETMDAGLGWKWSTLDVPLDDNIPYSYPAYVYEIEKKQTLTRAQILTAAANVGKINDRIFHGFVAYTMRLDSFSTDENYKDGLLDNANITYSFTIRGRDWREYWHKAEQKIDRATGTPMIWQNVIATDDAGIAMENYTTDAAKVDTPVFFSGARGGNITSYGDGWGAWYKPYYKNTSGTAIYLYEVANFGSVLSLPIITGDTAI